MQPVFIVLRFQNEFKYNKTNSNTTFFDLFFGIYVSYLLIQQKCSPIDAHLFATPMTIHKLFRFFGHCSCFGSLRWIVQFSRDQFVSINWQYDDGNVNDVGWHANQTKVFEYEIQQVRQVQRQSVRYQSKKHLNSGGCNILEKSYTQINKWIRSLFYKHLGRWEKKTIIIIWFWKWKC